MTFVEVVGAGIATAVTGYLIAHFGGYWSSPTSSPAALQSSPSISVVTKAPRMPAAKPAVVDTAPLPAAAKVDAAPAKDTGPVAPPAHATANAAPATPVARKPAAAEAHAVESREAESKPREAESKPRDKEDSAASVEERVRAALAKVDASRPPPEPVVVPTPARQIEILPPPAAVVTAPPVTPTASITPRPAEAPPAAIVVPPPADITPPAASAPKAPAPLDAVEIKSQPVAAVDPAAPPATLAPAKDSAQADSGGLLATIKKIPEMFRPPAGATTSDPPRPPMPVGDNQ
jgi:hypothetical protein